MASVHPEKEETLRKCNAEINKALAYNTDLVWFANRLFAKSFITAIQQSNVQNVGVGDYAKASKLMESVMAQVSITPSKYDEFLGILEEEAALDDLVKLLNSTYAKITGKPRSHSQSVPRKRQAPKQDLELNMKNVTNALRPVSAWYRLGIQLGVPEYELKQIEGNFPKDGDRCRGEVLTYWFNNAEKQSWDVLADAVENAGHRTLANEIRGVTPEGTDEQTTSMPTHPRRRKVPAADQPSNSSSSAASSVSSPGGASHAQAKNKGPLLLFLYVVIIGGVVAGVWLLGSHYYVLNLAKLHSDTKTDLPTSDSIANKDNEQASTHKPDCHPIEDVSAVRDELRSVTEWKTLGEELKVPREVLENIDSNNPKAERKLVETIHKWFNFMEKPCWEMVVKALKRMLLNKLASEIAGRHGVNYNEA